jgi:putative lipoic acid-binding regulatory protein
VATPEPPSLIEYPSLFPVKVMGTNDPGFEQAMVDVAMRFDPSYDRATLQLRPSSGGKYIGLPLSINATSREQLDALYRSLSGHPLVKVVL